MRALKIQLIYIYPLLRDQSPCTLSDAPVVGEISAEDDEKGEESEENGRKFNAVTHYIAF